MEQIGTCDVSDTGSVVSFMPDPIMFQETTVFDYDTLKQRMREMAFLTKGLRIVLMDLRVETPEKGEEPKKPRKHEFYFEGGIKEFVSYLNRSKSALYPEILYFEGT
ncbi:MAG: DNA topoisomerase IV subunit B, partial [Kiritimatiellae bacterium]|nr:DNA topoisomerase IV subunit B [Kiritimatiellia bacterium]